jgi:hypothetical protein
LPPETTALPPLLLPVPVIVTVLDKASVVIIIFGPAIKFNAVFSVSATTSSAPGTEILEKIPRGAGNEYQLTDAINVLCQKRDVYNWK